jgi:type VI protein secretion system component VasF
LNLQLPVDDLDSITEAAAKEARRQLRKAVRRFEKLVKQAGLNQTPDTNRPPQSKDAA